MHTSNTHHIDAKRPIDRRRVTNIAPIADQTSVSCSAPIHC